MPAIFFAAFPSFSVYFTFAAEQNALFADYIGRRRKGSGVSGKAVFK